MLDPLRIGQSLRETMDADLAAKIEAGALYREVRCYRNSVGDDVTMKLFDALVGDEEGHVDFLETRISLFDRIGAERYAILNALPADQAEWACPRRGADRLGSACAGRG